MSDVRPLGNNVFLVDDDGRTTVAYAAVDGSRTWVFIDGAAFVVGAGSDTVRERADDQAGLAAPMPATVLAINVAPGDRVAAGDVLLLLEAMKMELPVKAPRDGEVRRLLCTAGELVQPGVPLIELA